MAENPWYVLRVRIGFEENVRQKCQEQISSEIIKDCYVFRYEEQKHVHGEWIVQEQVLFPGYVFLVFEDVEAEKIEQIEQELSGIKGAIELLKADDEPAVLKQEEVNLLRTFGGRGHRVKLSEGIIERSRVRVYSGPLAGKEKYIRKIDRHKRRAVLEMPMFGGTKRVQVGLEIVSKT